MAILSNIWKDMRQFSNRILFTVWWPTYFLCDYVWVIRIACCFNLFSIHNHESCAYSCLWITGTSFSHLPIDDVIVLKQDFAWKLFVILFGQSSVKCDEGSMQLHVQELLYTIKANQDTQNHKFDDKTFLVKHIGDF